MSLIPALKRQTQADLSELQATQGCLLKRLISKINNKKRFNILRSVRFEGSIAAPSDVHTCAKL